MAKIIPAPSAPTALDPIEAQGNLRISAPDSDRYNLEPTATSARWQNSDDLSVRAILPRISELGYRRGTYANQSSSVSSHFLRSGCHLPLGSSNPETPFAFPSTAVHHGDLFTCLSQLLHYQPLKERHHLIHFDILRI